jgi:GTP-binding protein
MKHELPIVTIIGRQNVGKSTLFNTIIKEKKAIVDEVPGLTRDIIAFAVQYKSNTFVLNDTPGLDLPDRTRLSQSIIANTMNHLQSSSVIILLLENPAPTPYDMDLVEMIRKLSKPAVLAVNKMDSGNSLENMVNFYELGLTEIIPISALGRFNITLLLDTVTGHLPAKKSSIPAPDLRLAVVGRPNSGKYTLLNSLIGFERSLVSEIPGTTRDSVDDIIIYHKKRIQIIDTAGIRKRSNIRENIEYYSLTRTIESIRKCDVVIHLIDAEAGLTETDKKISDEIVKAKRPIIIAINKWDLIPKDDKTFNRYKDDLRFKFYKTVDFPVISISAKDKLRIHRLIDTAMKLHERASRAIDTPRLNKFLENLQKSKRLPQIGDKIKVFYATQTESSPPEFIFFVNRKEFFKKDVVRYFEKALQQEFDMKGVPVAIRIEERRKK